MKGGLMKGWSHEGVHVHGLMERLSHEEMVS